MITNKLIKELDPIVRNSIAELFNRIRQNEDFILFLANGHETDTIIKDFSKYVIGPGEEGTLDFDRTNFFNFYVNIPFEKLYNESNDIEQQNDLRNNSLHFELMIYSHFWEAIPVLKMLKHLSNLVSGKPYDWNINVPKMAKHQFIRDIRTEFKNNNLSINEIITNAYHSQIRNAFAHSQYSFSNDYIHLGNFEKGNDWQIQKISLENWEKRFLYTALIFHNINVLKKETLKTLSNNDKIFEVKVPDKNNNKKLNVRKIKFRKEFNDFRWN